MLPLALAKTVTMVSAAARALSVKKMRLSASMDQDSIRRRVLVMAVRCLTQQLVLLTVLNAIVLTTTACTVAKFHPLHVTVKTVMMDGRESSVKFAPEMTDTVQTEGRSLLRHVHASAKVHGLVIAA